MNSNKKIWIDLDNSPHVPFFNPIVQELERRSYKVVVTARDCFQVCGLADLLKVSYKKIGRHYGKNKALKIIGTLYRSLQLIPTALRERPSLSVSHGSRSQLLATWILRIPSVIIYDYEHTQNLVFIKPDWIIAPEVIPEEALNSGKKRVLRYPGIKEDVYAPSLKPDNSIRSRLGISESNLLVTIRPPATEAHYHNEESEALFDAIIEFLGRHDSARMVILPRNEIKQTNYIREKWTKWCESGKIIVPDFVVDGMNLIWHSDFVVSGGGTMNREAAALNVPVYSIFRGKIGAVDRHLANEGRLTLIEKIEEIPQKIILVSRNRIVQRREVTDNLALQKIVTHIDGII